MLMEEVRNLIFKMKPKSFSRLFPQSVVTSTTAINMFEKSKNVNSDFSFFQVEELYSLYSVSRYYKVLCI